MNAKRLSVVRGQKRVVDTLLVVAFAPLIVAVGAATAVAVALSMGRPVIFAQQRVGLNERMFTVLKFRTMSDRRDAQGVPLPDRERITRTGRLLRKLSLDEIPQIVNVLRGEMALIGPRPLLPEYVPHYRGRERDRHLLRPGLTGLAQVRGRNGLSWDDRLALDADYVEQAGTVTDLRILGATILKVLPGSGVSTIANDSGERLDVLRSYPTSNGLALRRFEYTDIPDRVRLFHDPRIRRFMSLPSDLTEETTTRWLRASRQDHGRKDFVVHDLASGALIALLGLRERAVPGVPVMYIMVDPTQQGKGHGAAALRLLLEWMETQGGYRGCCLSVDQANAAAVALYRRAGFEVVNQDAQGGRLEMQYLWSGLP